MGRFFFGMQRIGFAIADVVVDVADTLEIKQKHAKPANARKKVLLIVVVQREHQRGEKQDVFGPLFGAHGPNHGPKIDGLDGVFAVSVMGFCQRDGSSSIHFNVSFRIPLALGV